MSLPFSNSTSSALRYKRFAVASRPPKRVIRTAFTGGFPFPQGDKLQRSRAVAAVRQSRVALGLVPSTSPFAVSSMKLAVAELARPLSAPMAAAR